MSSSRSHADWVMAGTGHSPEVAWSFATDAGLVDFDMALETGEVLAGDVAGGLSLLDGRGTLETHSRGFSELTGVAFCDTGEAGAVVLGGRQLCRIDRDFQWKWSVELPDDVLTIAIEPFGEYIAASLANGRTYIYDAQKNRTSLIETSRPLQFLAFVPSQPALIGAADHGLLCRRRLDGEPEWDEQLWSTIGDLAISGDGRHILLAGFNHGVMAFDGDGISRGSYVVEGTPARIGMSYTPRRMGIATVERHLYWIGSNGDMLWASVTPEDVLRLRVDPLGRGMICGLVSGRLVALQWD